MGACLGAGRNLKEYTRERRRTHCEGEIIWCVEELAQSLLFSFKRRQKTSGKLLICLVCPPCYPHSVSHRPLTEHIPSLSPVSGFLLQTFWGRSDTQVYCTQASTSLACVLVLT